MKTVISILSIIMLLGMSVMGQETNKKSLEKAKSQSYQTMYIQGFDSISNI